FLRLPVGHEKHPLTTLVKDVLAELTNQNGDMKKALAALGISANDNASSTNVGLTPVNEMVKDLVENLKVNDADLKSIDEKLESISQKNASDGLRRKIEEEKEKKELEFQWEMNQAQGSIYLVSVMVGFVNPKASKFVLETGSAGIKIINAIHAFESVGALVTTGNIVGAIQGLVSAFQPDPAALRHAEVMNALNTIHEQIVQVREEMHERFDRLDKAVAQALEKLDDISDNLAAGQITLASQLEDVKKELNAISNQLFEGFFYIDPAAYDFKTAYDEAIASSRLAMKAMDADKFESYRRKFSFHARETSLLPHISGESLGTSSCSLVTETLEGYPSFRLFGYVGKLSKEYLGTGFNTLPNPMEWAKGVEAYLLLRRLQGEYKDESDDLDTLLSNGNRLMGAIDAFSNKEFLKKAIDFYEQKLQAVIKTTKDMVQESQGELSKDMSQKPADTLPSISDENLTLFYPNNVLGNEVVKNALLLGKVKLVGDWSYQAKQTGDEVVGRKAYGQKIKRPLYDVYINIVFKVIDVSTNKELGVISQWQWHKNPLGDSIPRSLDQILRGNWENHVPDPTVDGNPAGTWEPPNSEMIDLILRDLVMQQGSELLKEGEKTKTVNQVAAIMNSYWNSLMKDPALVSKVFEKITKKV
ncbi:MAG TPA: hypothetical protein VJL87_04500, partial [Bdellovibrionota bacterium]|nr:hypothetical protein [Bdellovibrionota bacterium]